MMFVGKILQKIVCPYLASGIQRIGQIGSKHQYLHTIFGEDLYPVLIE